MDMGTIPARVEENTKKLGHLSEEVERIVSTLARMTIRPGISFTPHSGMSANDGYRSDIPIETVQKAIQVRRLRYEFFDNELFADPAWDMLLDLYQAGITQHRVTVTSLCSASAVPNTTALRWIKTLTNAGLIHRRPDRHDARRFFVELSPMAWAGMNNYFKKISDQL